MQNEDKIIFAKQSYREAREGGLVDELELLGMVTADSSNGPCGLKERLEKNAIEIGATHVFGIEFQVVYVVYPLIMVSGDAYRPIKR